MTHNAHIDRLADCSAKLPVDQDALFSHVDGPYGDGKVLAAINAHEDPIRDIAIMLHKLGPVIRGNGLGDPAGSLLQFGELIMPNILVPTSCCAGDVFAVTNWEAASVVYGNSKLFSSKIFENTLGAWGPILTTMDPPEHGKYRRVMQQGLTPADMKRYQDSIIRPIIERRFAQLKPKGRSDFARDVSSTYVYEIVGRLVGFAPDEVNFVATCFHHLFNINRDPATGWKAAADLRAYAARLIDLRRTSPADDLISSFVGAQVDGQPIDEQHLIGFVTTLLAGAIDTVYSQSGIILFLLIEHPDQQSLLRGDRSLIPRFIDEAIRYQGTSGWGARQATEDIELLGMRIPKESVVITLLGVINRDLARWHDPHELNVLREPKPHIGFASGAHFCAGAHLARSILRVLVEHILDDLPNVRWDPGEMRPKVTGWMQRRPLTLPIIWDRA